jgi:hypothetical protein
MQTADIDREVRNFIVMHFLSGGSDRLRDDGSVLGDVIDSTGVIELVIVSSGALRHHRGG